MITTNANTNESIDTRTIRAATECMSIDRHAGEASEFDVYSESGSVYRVCLITETCDCPSTTSQDGACKHQRRVERALGQREVPDLDEETDVEMMIAAHARTSANANEVATDGGVTIENAGENCPLGYTEHIEPPNQGGKTYVRCEGCGRELLSELGGRDSLPHAKNCPNATH